MFVPCETTRERRPGVALLAILSVAEMPFSPEKILLGSNVGGPTVTPSPVTAKLALLVGRFAEKTPMVMLLCPGLTHAGEAEIEYEFWSLVGLRIKVIRNIGTAFVTARLIIFVTFAIKVIAVFWDGKKLVSAALNLPLLSMSLGRISQSV